MAQITLYLDERLEARLRAAAQAANLSQSRWVANLIAEKLDDEWPAAVTALAGAWPDLPEVEAMRATLGQDTVREPIE
ncbi:CopG family transcriptional regulator [Candidatus Leptofilum sp.]|uniref:CopG family transcriptional regulator n=1 Tax=Candidatus Leptofilum sp. TaxID=3241576 RepID=UPI003B5AE0FE